MTIQNKEEIFDNRSDRIFTADYALKTIVVPEDEKIIGVKGDNTARLIRFQLVNIPDVISLLSPSTVVEVQYENAVGETGRQRVTVHQADETSVYFDFYLTPGLTKAQGKVRLQICATQPHPSGGIYHWHLAPVSVEIADFFAMENTAAPDPDGDIIIQINADLQALETSVNEIKATLGNLTAGDAATGSVAAEITALKARMTAAETFKLDSALASDMFASKDGLEAYLTQADADAVYLKAADAEAAYMTQEDADTRYATKYEAQAEKKWTKSHEISTLADSAVLGTETAEALFVLSVTGSSSVADIKLIPSMNGPLSDWIFHFDGSDTAAQIRIEKAYANGIATSVIVTAMGSKGVKTEIFDTNGTGFINLTITGLPSGTLYVKR